MQLPMICTCSFSGVQESEMRRLRIFQRLGLTDMRELTTVVILSLAFDFGADVDLYADQWFGISLTSPLVDERLEIECDHPADGLAALWEYLVEKFPECATAMGAATSFHTQVTNRVSEALLSHYEAQKACAKAHREAEHADRGYTPTCVDCAVGLNLSIAAHLLLGESWGSHVLDAAIVKAFER